MLVDLACDIYAWSEARPNADHERHTEKLEHAITALGISEKPDPGFIPPNLSHIFSEKGVELADLAEISRQYEYLHASHLSIPQAI